MPKSYKNIIWVSLLACFWAVQAAVVLTQILGLWHVPSLLNGSLLPEAAGRMAAKWDILIYVVFIAVALISGKIIFQYESNIIPYGLLVFEGAVTFLMVSAVMKLVIYDHSPQLAQWALTGLIIISLACKIFYPEFKKITGSLSQRLNVIPRGPYADAWWIMVIVLMIYMPDLERVIAMIFTGECLHHFDFLIMSVGWASLCGQLPYVDVIAQYGVGLPVIFAKVINACGGFDYVSALGVMMGFVMVYFILMYFFVRDWLGPALIAGVAFLLVFRLQMFHYGVSPLIWCVASASPIRFGLDILWMWAILRHIRSGKSRWLVVAAVYSGFAVYYMTSSGMCVMATFYAYLSALIVLPSLRKLWIADSSRRLAYACCWVLPVLSALVFFGATLKGHIFQKEYWHNFIDYMVVFGHTGAIPIYENLKYRHFWAFFMSLSLPLTYVATLLYISVGLYFEEGPRERLFAALLCIYGLANYQYFVVRAASTSYYVNALPFVLVVCYWFMRVLEFLPLAWQKRLKVAAVALSFYALLTNQNYLAYPNLMNFSRNPMTDNLVIQRFPDRGGYFNHLFKKTKEQDKLPVNDLGTSQEDLRTEDDFKSDAQLADYYRAHFDFKKDAALIDRLTKPGQRVALLSSFETKILIQANRAPFFYHFPMLTSRPMTFRTFPTDAAQTPAYGPDTLKALAEGRPEYIFMEKVFLQDFWPASYRENNPLVFEVVTTIKAHYQAFEQGQYLVAMKRKAGE